MMRRIRFLSLALLFSAFAAAPLHGEAPQATDKSVAEMSTAATNFLAALTPELKAKANLKFDDEYRTTWHFVPNPPTPRKGVTIKEMTSDERALAQALLSSGLSQKGYAEAVTIMSLDAILKELEKGKQGSPTRDPELYYFTVYGTPGGKEPWGWRVEGHHLSVHFTIVDGKVAVGGPAFFGTNPAEVMDGPRKGLRLLAVEEDLGRALLKSMTPEQKKAAITTATAPKDIVSMANRKAMLLDPVGVTYAQMNDDQKKQAANLVREYADRLRGELAADDMARIAAAGWDKVQFAWAGGTERGEGHYYRVQGPTFLIEYDNTQNNANHVHSVWRDLTRDFGEDLLGKHLDEVKH